MLIGALSGTKCVCTIFKYKHKKCINQFTQSQFIYDHSNIHPSPKVLADFSRLNNQHDAFIPNAQLLVDLLTRFAPRFKGDEMR